MKYFQITIVFLALFCIKSRLIPSQAQTIISDPTRLDGTWVHAYQFEGTADTYDMEIVLRFNSSTKMVFRYEKRAMLTK